MEIFGKEILFDASLHITLIVLTIYSFWLFIEKEKHKKILLLLTFLVAAAISFQRIYVGAHNLIGLLSGFFVSFLAIIVSETFINDLKNKNKEKNKN